MKKNRFLLNVIIIFFIAENSFAAGSSKIEDYKLITEDYAPFNYYQDNKIVGISFEILEKVLIKMKASKNIKDIKIAPWLKSFNQVQVTENTMFFSVARTKARENLFKWVGPIISSKFVIFAKKNSNIKISSYADLKSYKIGVLRGDYAEDKIKSIGIESKYISANEDITTNLKKILTGRVDLLVIQENSLKPEMNKIEENFDDLEKVFELSNKDLYFAFNFNTPDDLLKKFSESLEEVKKSKIYYQIIDKYLNINQ